MFLPVFVPVCMLSYSVSCFVLINDLIKTGVLIVIKGNDRIVYLLLKCKKAQYENTEEK